MKKLIFLIIILSIPFSIHAGKFFGMGTSVFFNVDTGIGYKFKISNDYTTQTDNLFLMFPLNFNVDIRYVEWFSLSPGLEFIYGLHVIENTVFPDRQVIYLHNLIINTPFLVKFYPFVYKDDRFYQLYFAVGGYLHFWPLQMYYTRKNDQLDIGSCYSPGFYQLPPNTVYNPVNIGLKLAFGNHYYISDKSLIGIQLFLDYLFLPVINGFYSTPAYKRKNTVELDFNLSLGIVVSFSTLVYQD